jgi:type II secretory pathway pseudopilin PulG
MRNRTPLLLLLSAALVACSGVGSDTDSRVPVDIDAWNGELPISAPWLRERLPAGVLSYQRIPHPLGLLAIPKGNMLDIALGSEANIRNLIGIQQGLAENLASGLPPLALVDALRSPIEIAGIGAPPLTSVILGATLSFRSNAEFEAWVAEISQFSQGAVSLAGPLDGDGFGQFLLPPGMPVQIFVNFDQTSGRLALYGGLVANRQSFASLLDAAETLEHPMHAIEAQIDDSGQGLFAWVDAAQALQAGAAALPPAAIQAISAMQIRSFGLGAGVANGKGRLKLLLDVGTDNPNRPLPVVTNRITATSVGDTRYLFLVSIPGTAEFTRLEGLVLANFPPEMQNVWGETKAGFAEATGTSIEEILSAVGPELITISDRAGDYFALHVNDQDLFDSVLSRWTSNAEITIGERRIQGQTIRSIELPASFGVPQSAVPPEAAVWLDTIRRMRTRFYWVADGDYLYLAGTPQVLMDRIGIGADSRVADWLSGTQRFDVSSSMLAMTGSAERLPQMMYNGYVGMMQTFADLAGVEYDVWSMPTANQLGLPARGTLGASINLGEPYVALELSYESHPAELLVGMGGMAAVAGVGIVAAIALPAYQDYTIRAQVSEGLNLAAAARTAVAEAYQSTGGAPADRAAAGLTPEPTDMSGRFVDSIDVVDGEIIVRYGNQAHQQVANRSLVITPYAGSGGGVVFRCGYAQPPANLEPIGAATANGTTLAPKYLPSGCRP